MRLVVIISSLSAVHHIIFNMAESYFALKIIRRNRVLRQTGVLERENTLVNTGNGSIFPKESCRICLKIGSIPIYDGKTAIDTVASIQTFGDIQLDCDDNFPKYLCLACHSLLQSAILFRKMAKESEKILRREQDREKIANNCDINVDTDDSNDYQSYESTIKRYRCKVCKLDFNSCEEYIVHKNSTLHRKVRIQCTICHRLLTAQMFKRHLAKHETASHLVCEVCGKIYRKDNLIRHLQLHSFELPYQCQVCPYRGRYLDALKIHMRSHTGDKPYCCDKCDLRFLTRSNLNRHLLTHRKDRPFKCQDCGRGFYTKRESDIHFKSDHAGIKDFGCRICGNKYGTRKALRRHELIVHKREKMAQGRKPLYLQVEYTNNIVLTES